MNYVRDINLKQFYSYTGLKTGKSLQFKGTWDLRKSEDITDYCKFSKLDLRYFLLCFPNKDKKETG